jgi:hypothetical protein
MRVQQERMHRLHERLRYTTLHRLVLLQRGGSVAVADRCVERKREYTLALQCEYM